MPECIFALLVFVFILIWFNYLHPLIIYDGDDWWYMSYIRNAFPWGDSFNPSRIFPETFMALPAGFAAHVLTPITNDYIGSIKTAYAFTAAVFITAYMILFMRLIKRRLFIGHTATVVTSFVFLMYHFGIFKKWDSNNQYMFSTENVTCFFFYTMCNIIACIAVFCFATYNINDKFGGKISKERFSGFNWLKNGVLLLLIYLCTFSNLFASVIFATFVGVDMVFSIVSSIRKRESFKQIVKKNIYSLLVVILWLICLYYEAGGGRANSFTQPEEFRSSVEKILDLLNWQNQLIAISCVVFTVTAVCIFLFKKKKSHEDHSFIHIVLVLAGSCFMTAVFLVLLGTRTGVGYLGRADAIYGLPFYGLLISAFSLAYVLKNTKRAAVLLPLFLYFVFVQMTMGTHMYKENIRDNLSPEKATAVDHYIVNSVVDAVREGKTEMVLRVPRGDRSTWDNWPHPEYMGANLAITLRKHGIIDSDITINIEPDESLNEEFDLPY